MTNTDTTYNGWTNYETWCVNLWLSNDEYTDSLCREVAADAMTEGKGLYRAADALKDLVEQMPQVEEVTDKASFVTDLLLHSLARVDWLEVAEAFAPEVEA